MLRLLALTAALLAFAGDARAQQTPPRDQPGDAYEIRLTNVTESSSDDGSSSSSRSGGSLIERVVAVRDDGVELEFDLPADATDAERARDWQWPARVLKSADGSLSLLNAPEVEARIEAWLTLGGMTREACGHWIFTWNAFEIECDPQSVLDTLAPYDLRIGDVREGAPYVARGGLGTVALQPASSEPDGSTFVAETPLDPDLVRRSLAESDVMVGEVMGEPTSIEAALEARASDQVTGTITTSLVTDADGRVTRRTTTTRMTTVTDGVTERSTGTLIVERRPIAAREP